MAFNFGNTPIKALSYSGANITQISYLGNLYKLIDTMVGTQAVSPAITVIYSGYLEWDEVTISKQLASIATDAPTYVSGNIVLTMTRTGGHFWDSFLLNGGYIDIGGVQVTPTPTYLNAGEDLPTVATIQVPVAGTITNRTVSCNLNLGGYNQSSLTADFSGLVFS